MQAITRCLADVVKRRMTLGGISRQLSTRHLSSSWRLAGCTGRRLSCLSRWSHKCSIGFMSGEHAGHGKTLILLLFKKSCVSLAVWGLALSCWKRIPCGCCWIKGSATGCKMSYRYLCALRLPWMMTSLVFNSPQIPPHTNTLFTISSEQAKPAFI